MNDCSSATCSICGAPMPLERLEFFSTCVNCTDQATYTGYMVYGHKTAGNCQMVKPSNKEAIRLAERANKRCR